MTRVFRVLSYTRWPLDQAHPEEVIVRRSLVPPSIIYYAGLLSVSGGFGWAIRPWMGLIVLGVGAMIHAFYAAGDC